MLFECHKCSEKFLNLSFLYDGSKFCCHCIVSCNKQDIHIFLMPYSPKSGQLLSVFISYCYIITFIIYILYCILYYIFYSLMHSGGLETLHVPPSQKTRSCPRSVKPFLQEYLNRESLYFLTLRLTPCSTLASSDGSH